MIAQSRFLFRALQKLPRLVLVKVTQNHPAACALIILTIFGCAQSTAQTVQRSNDANDSFLSRERRIYEANDSIVLRIKLNKIDTRKVLSESEAHLFSGVGAFYCRVGREWRVFATGFMYGSGRTDILTTAHTFVDRQSSGSDDLCEDKESSKLLFYSFSCNAFYEVVRVTTKTEYPRNYPFHDIAIVVLAKQVCATAKPIPLRVANRDDIQIPKGGNGVLLVGAYFAGAKIVGGALKNTIINSGISENILGINHVVDRAALLIDRCALVGSALSFNDDNDFMVHHACSTDGGGSGAPIVAQWKGQGYFAFGMHTGYEHASSPNWGVAFGPDLVDLLKKTNP